jgi:hypothetical protein
VRGTKAAVNLPGGVRLRHPMISSLLLPSAVRLATYAWVRSSLLITVERNHVQRPVGFAIAMRVEAVADHFARGGFYGRHTAQVREGSLALSSVGSW